MLASRREGGAKLLQKALDRCHRTAIARAARTKEPSGLLALWDASLKHGDIPGAYWATLTHPEATEDVVKRVFSDVHMLSHLVGAANRADIQRLRQLEQENAELAAKIERQQRHLRDGFAERDLTIRRLREMLVQHTVERADPPCQREEDSTADSDSLLGELKERLARETARSERSERRAGELTETIKELRRGLEASQQQAKASRLELETVEQQIASLLHSGSRQDEAPKLSGFTFLYVGGRTHHIPQLKDVTERTGARFLHHDGGIEHSPGLLAGLVSRADRVFFPIDCISHEAAASVKRLCRTTAKTYEPLRTASLTCLLAALVKISETGERLLG